MSESARRRSGRRKRELGRADKVLPGLWRLRLPLEWPGVPHVNAFAIAAGSGVVLVDTGMDVPGGLRQLELALDQAGLRLEHVRLVVCTHAHSDHYGLAGPILDAAGCELWLNPNLDHMRTFVADPDGSFDRRLEQAGRNGVPAAAIEALKSRRKPGQGSGVARLVEPDRDLVNGVEVETDLGTWRAYETPGHAPSHVVLHQPERRLLLSGDHLMGRVSIFYDSDDPDPPSEFLRSMDVVDALDVDLVLAGHGKPVREAHALIEANRREVHDRIARVRGALSDQPITAFEIVPVMLGDTEPDPMMIGWVLGEIVAYLKHLELRGEAVREEGPELDRWTLAT